MKNTNTLIFDMDGVISDTELLKFEAYRKVFAEFFGADIKDDAWRIGLDEERVVRGYLERSMQQVKKTMAKHLLEEENNRIKMLFGNCKEQILSALEKQMIPDCIIPIVGKLKREKYAELLETSLKPVPGAPEFVKYAKGHYVLGIATGSTRAEAEKILAKFGIIEYFSAIITRDDIGIGRGKPLPDIYIACLKKLKAEPENCLVIEDGIAGIQSAIAANLKAIAIATTTPKQKLIDAGATYVVDSFEEMKKYL